MSHRTAPPERCPNAVGGITGIAPEACPSRHVAGPHVRLVRQGRSAPGGRRMAAQRLGGTLRHSTPAKRAPRATCAPQRPSVLHPRAPGARCCQSLTAACTTAALLPTRPQRASASAMAAPLKCLRGTAMAGSTRMTAPHPVQR
jgi:hypothetical protein